MEEGRIQPGQVWIVDLYGSRAQVLVICPHTESLGAWLCERLTRDQAVGTGPHVVVQRERFVRLEAG